MCNKTLVGEAQVERQRSYDSQLNLLDLQSDEATTLVPKPRSVSPQRYNTWNTSAMQIAWFAHFGATLTVLLCGAWTNYERYDGLSFRTLKLIVNRILTLSTTLTPRQQKVHVS